jgi:hypothetical protein
MFKKFSNKADDIAGKIADSKAFNAIQKVVFFGAPTTNELAEQNKPFKKMIDECLNRTNNTTSSAKGNLSSNGK